MKLRDIISPFFAWKRALEKPFTIKRPVTEREGLPRYRGFHVNDVDLCVGCGTCEKVCQNEAIDMKAVEGLEPRSGDSGLRPAIDYGRCCWCALCVDICPTNSLGMSNEYNWLSDDGEDWVFVPGIDDKKWNLSKKGYRCDNGAWLLDPEMRDMPVIEPDLRRRSFDEMALGYTEREAEEEAMRCIECGLCVAACPAHMDVPQYIRSVREGNLEEGLKLLYDTNPFSESCGRICTARCQEACPLGHRGEPIMIRWLKRYITDRTIERRDEILGLKKVKRKESGKSVAVVGGGPAGLTAAFYLRLYGHRVTVYEQNEKLGGMLRYGIPVYRLPDDVLDREIALITKTGVDVKTGVRVSEDINLDELKDKHDALYLAVGAWQGSRMPIDGMDSEGVHIGIDFLERVARGERPGLGRRVVVVGGGNTAMDVCRSALRLGSEEVTVLYRRTEEQMPAAQEEIDEAREEGVVFDFLVAPKSISRAGGVLNIECLRMKLGEPDESGRRRPEQIPRSEFIFEADTCVMAIGQQVQQDAAGKSEIKTSRWETFEVEPYTHRTSVEGIYAGGDCMRGPDDAISAIADGRKAAWAINRYLTEEKDEHQR